MRVAYVCIDAGIPVFGRKGGSVHVQEILRAFLRRGADVTLFAASIGDERPADLGDVRVVPVVASDAIRDRTRFDLALGDLLKRESRVFDLVYERHALWSSSAMRFAEETGTPSVLEINAPLVDEQRRYRRLESPEIADRMAIDAIERASVRVVVSRGVAEAHARYGFAVSDFTILPNGVSADRFEGVRVPRGRTDPFRIGFVGSLKPWHGVEVLLDAFDLLAEEVPSARLIIVGDGPMRMALEQWVQDSPFGGRIELVGAVAPEEIPRQLERFDVGVAPYPSAEGHYFSPLKIFEYMAASLPVVASRVGQIPEIIRQGGEGRLVEPGDAAQLADALVALAMRPDVAFSMGAAGRKRVIENHGWDGVLRRTLEAVGRATGRACRADGSGGPGSIRRPG